MRYILLILMTVIINLTVSAQFVAKLQVNEPIDGICDIDEVYALFPSLDGQEEAICPISKDAILKRLNTEMKFLKHDPKHKDEGMIGLILNCEGEVVKCEMDNNTKSPELDKQIEDVFNSLGAWKPGKLNGKEVDSSILFSFKIKKGVVRWSY